MLAIIPVTKTTASRLTPEIRDKSAFGAVFSDHMLVADYGGDSISLHFNRTALGATAAAWRATGCTDGVLFTNSFGSALQMWWGGVRATGYRKNETFDKELQREPAASCADAAV